MRFNNLSLEYKMLTFAIGTDKLQDFGRVARVADIQAGRFGSGREIWLSPVIQATVLGRPEQWAGLRWNDLRQASD
jgi:hypothetical protein